VKTVPPLALAVQGYTRFVFGMWDLKDILLGMSVTSLGRSVAHNNSFEGAVPDSEHLTWTAADVIFDPDASPDPGYFKALCREVGIEAQQEPDHWHL
jgi:hypothetical protein